MEGLAPDEKANKIRGFKAYVYVHMLVSRHSYRDTDNVKVL